MTTADVEVRADGARVDIVITGEIDLSNSERVREEIFGSIDNRLTEVRLDLGELKYLDSAGLRILFALAERLRLLQTSCTIVSPVGSPTRRVLEMSGVGAVAELQP
ncbi:STAS domain-containing protein [Saccharomonospora iraqiensis]|uniref:STAS domain-containing protein n=1 Tax=Saccharomonospora iraqiensis TaxID=52698 RepID=UPI00022E249D|nr:STAS domain-containing protein [Saccharomonospora iraqiensis]